MITSLKNPLIKQVVGLKDKRDRDRLGLFVIEGEKELIHAVENKIAAEIIIYCDEILSGNSQLNSLATLKDFIESSAIQITDWVEVSAVVFARMAYRDQAGGIIALARKEQHSLDTLSISEIPLLLVVEGIEKPGNLGALLRTADAAGVDAVIICDPGVDLYNPNVIRSSLGAVFTVQTVADSTDQILHWLQQRNIQIVVSSPAATKSYTELNYNHPTAIVLGSEKEGLSPAWLEQNDHAILIPMRGQMDSLNLSTSGAILLYEAVRQRGL